MKFLVTWAGFLTAAVTPPVYWMPTSAAAFMTTHPLQHVSPVMAMRKYHTSPWTLHAKPKQGSVVDSYQTVSVNCAKCRGRLFRYKKKNGTKSNLVKCYIERITEDSVGLLAKQQETDSLVGPEDFAWECPNCQTRFARSSLIHGQPALKLVGGKVRMTKS